MTINILCSSFICNSDRCLVDSDLIGSFVCVCDSHAYAVILRRESDVIRIAVLVNVACAVVGHAELFVCARLRLVSSKVCIIENVLLTALCT